MNKNIAKKAIDYYFKVFSDAISKVPKSELEQIFKIIAPGISWWGGEPFLNFSLIKFTKKYFESLPWEKLGIKSSQFVYSVATNFTVINKDILDFIIDSDMFLFISLDGGEKEHDTNRIFSNGQGSFSSVIKNISFLLQKHPTFCKKRLVIQSVKAENIDINSAYNFINQNFNIEENEQKKILKYISHEQKKIKQYLPTSAFNLEYTKQEELSPRFYKRYAVIKKVFTQQQLRFEGHEVKDMIVSIDKSYIHPIVRGKETKTVEFGAKVNMIQIDGINFIEPLSFSAFHEGIRLP